MPERRYTLVALAVIVAITLVVFATIVGFNFVHADDDINIFKNPHLQPPLTVERLGYFWSHSYYELYMPVTFTLWVLCAAAAPLSHPLLIPGGEHGPEYAAFSPALFHAVSLVLHTANTMLVLLLLLRLLPGAGQPGVRAGAAAGGALLFGLHPLHVESVAWVTGMNNLTSGLFGLLALLHYVIYVQEGGTERRRYGFATLCFVLALLSKPSAAALPLAAAALAVGIGRYPTARWLRSLLPWVALSIACAIVTHFTASSGHRLPTIPVWARPVIAGDAVAWYLGKLFLPVSLGPNQGRSVEAVQGSGVSHLLALLPVALPLLLWRGGERTRTLLIAFAVFVAALLPMLGLIPYYATTVTTVADRHTYLALLGPALALAWCLEQGLTMPRLRPIAISTSLVLLGLLTLTTVRQLPIWRDTFALAEAETIVNPSDERAQYLSAFGREQRGDLPGAIQHYTIAARLKPNDIVCLYRLGYVTLANGDPNGAIPPLQSAVRQYSGYAEAQATLGVALARAGRSAEAVAPLQAALIAHPRDLPTRYILAVVLGNLHRDTEAETELAQVVAEAPDFPGAADALRTIRARASKTKAHS